MVGKTFCWKFDGVNDIGDSISNDGRYSVGFFYGDFNGGRYFVVFFSGEWIGGIFLSSGLLL